MEQRSVILLSAGLDSTVNCYEAKQHSDPQIAITFDYGQKAAAQEIMHAARTCRKLQIPHLTIKLPWMREITKTGLVSQSAIIPTVSPDNLDDISQGEQRAKAVWVPNRNGVFINIGAAYAESLGAEIVVVGFNAEEAETFPDNSPEFVQYVNHALGFSTLSQVQVCCYTKHLIKDDIVERAQELGVDFNNIWSCYYGQEKMCGACESCTRLIRGLQAIDIQPALQSRFNNPPAQPA